MLKDSCMPVLGKKHTTPVDSADPRLQHSRYQSCACPPPDHAMQRLQSQSKRLSRASSSTTVGTSYKTSFDHSKSSVDLSIGELGILQDTINMTTVSLPNKTCKKEKSANSSHIAAGSSTPAPKDQAVVHPDNVPESPPEHMNLHEALRSQLPAFKQSKRWAKAYLNKDDGAKPFSNNDHSPRRKRNVFACDTSTPSNPSATTHLKGPSDTESERDTLCKPTYVSGLQVFRRRRQRKQHPNHLTAFKAANAKDSKQTKPTVAARTRVSTSLQRPTTPEATERKPRQTSPGEKHSTNSHSRCSSISGRSQHPATRARGSTSPVSPLHDYEKVKWFTRECVDMLSGLDFGEEWRLSVIDKQLSTMQVSPTKTQILEKPGQHSRLSYNRAPVDIFQKAVDAAKGPALVCSQPGVLTDVEASMCQTKQIDDMTHNTLKDVASNAVYEPDYRADRYTSQPAFTIKHPASTPSFNKPTQQPFTQNLKNARSVDTLTMIEAQVDDASSVQHELKTKSSLFTVSPSPKRQTPFGGPPERPLPDIPRDDAPIVRGTTDQRSSCASSRKGPLRLDTTDDADPFVLGALQSMIGVPSDIVYKSGIHGADRKSTQSLKEETLPTELKVREIATERSNKIQEMKRRHVAAWSSSGASSPRSDARSIVGADRLLDIESEIRSRPLSQLSRRTGVDQLSKGYLGADRHVSRSGRVHNKVHDLVTPLTASISDGCLHVVTTARASQELVKRLSSVRQNFPDIQTKSQNLKTAVSTPHLYQWTTSGNKPKQALSRSHIMVVVDTNPHTSSFRAGALSPTPTTESSSSVRAGPCRTRSKKMLLKPLPPIPVSHQRGSSSDMNRSIEAVNATKRPTSVQKEADRQEVQVQAITKQSSVNMAKISPVRTSSLTPQSRGMTRAHRYHTNSSDSERETSLPKQTSTPSSQTRNTPKTSLYKSHRRADTPLTAVLKDEVRKADQELEELKKYEARIEYLQSHLEQTLRVWGRMSQNGKKQFLTSTFGTSTEGNDASLNPNPRTYTASVAASSIYSQRSSAQKPNAAVTKSLNEALKLAQGIVKDDHGVVNDMSAPSPAVLTRVSVSTDLDVDTDWSAETVDSRSDKRASGGSMTDPQDYDVPAPLVRRVGIDVGKSTNKFHELKAYPPATDLNALRARLQATRRPPVPYTHRLTVTSVSSTDTPPSKPAVVDLAKDSLKALSNRLAVAPWEKQEGINVQNILAKADAGSSDDCDDDDGDFDELFGRSMDTLRTDQMDAMLCL